MINKNGVTINLNNPKATVMERDNYVHISYLNKVIKLIKERIKDLGKSSNINTFESLRMHDAILIDGKRGTGKTTFLLNLKAELDREKKSIPVKVLDAIDPNQLDEKSNILLILLAHIYTELLEYINHNLDNKTRDKRNEYKKLTTSLHNITSAISASSESKYDDDYHKLYNLHESLIIDKKLHDFFSQVCDFFGIDALILPIDDIDMDFIHGYKVIDSIRKYLSTPKIIPIISIDTTQIYALIKKEHYTYFGYKANTPKNDIKPEHELSFLKNMPEAYLQKILMPTRKVVLPDVYELYQSHLTNNRYISIEYNSNIVDKDKNFKFNMKFDDALKPYTNVVFGSDEKNIASCDNIAMSNYLKNKSFRGFYEDMIAFFNGVSQSNKKDFYTYDTQSLKTRLIPFYMTHFDSKYDATIWFWEKYLSLLQEKITTYVEMRGKYSKNFYIDISKYILYIDSFNESSIPRHEQTYIRLYMQDFFVNKIEISSNQEDVITKFGYITKEINIAGIIELFTRTMFPMYIFETLINEGLIDIFKYNLNELILFARDNHDTLRDTMFRLSISILQYANDDFFQEPKYESNEKNSKLINKVFEKLVKIKGFTLEQEEAKAIISELYKKSHLTRISNKKIIGMFLTKKHKELFKEYSIFIEKYTDFRKDREIYFLSPLKFYSILPQYFKSIFEENIDEIKYSIHNYTREFSPSVDDIIYGIAFPLFNKKDIIFTLEDSNLGVVSIDTFTKDLVENILQVSIQDYSIDLSTKLKDSKIGEYKLFLDKNVNTYKMIYLNHLILFLVKKIDNKKFYNFNLDVRHITRGTHENDFCRYKIPESFFAQNIKKILIQIELDDNGEYGKYKSIEPFFYKLYLTMLKNQTYQSSYYIVKDNFNIEKYINRYLDEITEDNSLYSKKQKKEEQFKELYNLRNNLKSLYKEGSYLNSLDKDKEEEIHQELINKFSKEYEEQNQDGTQKK